VLMAALSLLASVTYAGEPTALTNGVAVTGISGAAGSETFYKIDVPAGQDTLRISTSGGTGDLDLYVRRGSQPTTTSYDYRPYKVGNDETVDVNNPAAGTWYILLRGYSSYSGVTLEAAYSAATSVKSLTNGVPAIGLSGAAGEELCYSIDVPAGQSKLEIAISGGTGDADLYVKKDSLPTTASYDYRPFLAGNNESVMVDAPAAGTWYIMIRGYSPFSGITLLASYGGGSGGHGGSVLSNGVAVTSLSGMAGSEKLYQFDVPAGQSNLQIEMSGGTGDADLYVRLKSAPTTTEYDYRRVEGGNNETVTVENPPAGTWFVMIRGHSNYAGVTLKASWGNVTTLQDEVPVKGLAGALDSETFFKINVPAGQTNLLFTMSGDTGNAELYVKKGARPTTSDWDYRASGFNKSISLTNDILEGTWYAMLKGTQAYDGVTLVANYSAVETVVALTNGVPVTNLSGVAGTQKFFSIDVPAGQTKFEIRISGGTGDADLYVRRGSKPTTSTYDYRPNLVGNDEAVTIDKSTAGTWYILVRGHRAFSGVTLLATYGGSTPDTVTTLQNGVAVTGLKGATGNQAFYKIEVPAGQSKLEVAMSGGTGDADLYVRKGSKPTLSDYDYRPYLSGNNETVTVSSPAAATWYILLNGYAAYDGITLKATYTPTSDQVTALTNGVPVTDLSGGSLSEKFYKIDVPAGQEYLTIETSGGTGDADLYVKKGAKPTISSWDYRPYLLGNDEKVDVTNPAATTWYILLKGYETYSGLTLEATYGSSAPTAGNNFTTDPNCVALWRFESGKLTTDSIGTNTLKNHGVTANTTDKKEAASSAELKAAQNDYFSIANTSLSSEFPFRSSSAPKTISVAFWMKLNSLPNAGYTYDPFSKVDNSTHRSTFSIMTDPFGHVGFFIGTSDSRAYEDAWTFEQIAVGKWYHVVVTYRDSDRSYRFSIWSAETGTVLVDRAGTLTNNIVVTDADICLGARQDLEANRFLDGLLDEMVVFNDVLTSDDIAKIRAATFGKTH
jgi:hypothetical protein